MQKLSLLLLLIVPFIMACGGDAPQSLTINYFGQQPPGLTPEPFAPAVFTFPDHLNHGMISFSPDGSQACWSVVPPKVLLVYNNGLGPLPRVAPFTRGNIQAPFFHPNGGKLYFQLATADGFGGLDIWAVDYQDTTWGEARNLGSPPNTAALESQPSLTRDGTLYYTGTDTSAMLNRGIYRCPQNTDGYGQPELLPAPVNTEYLDYTPCIAPDESFLLFASTRPSMQEDAIRIYVSYRHSDGSWSAPVNLNEKMGFDRSSRFPSLTPDGKYIIFLSGQEYYWVSSAILN